MTAPTDPDWPPLPSDALLSRLFDASPDPISVTELETRRLVRVNRSFAALFSAAGDPGDLLDRREGARALWVDAPVREAIYETLALAGQVQDIVATMRAADGRLLRMLVSGSVFEHAGRRYVIGLFRDVTASENRRLRYEAILAHARVAIAFTRDRHFEHVNPRFEAMFGWPAGELIGRPGRVVWPDDRTYEELSRVAGPLLGAGGQFDGEFQAARRDGSTFWAQVRAQALDPRHPGQGTIWIIDDLTERRAAERALADARDEAEAASRAKSEFLANTSHEIRTPLNGLLGLVRLAQEPALPTTRLRDYLARIDESAQQLAGIISDILDLSKIEAGRLTIEQLPFDLHGLLRGMGEAYAELAAAKGLAFRLDIAPGVPEWVEGDPVRLRQIAANYLSNALKFTDAGEIALLLEPLPRGGLRLEVRDSGTGIAPSVQPRLFHPFVQADASTTRRYGGTGLGLSICRQLAMLMGGGVGMQSSPGAGSRFWADLPLAPASAPRELAQQRGEAAAELRGARVLLVEDNAVNRLVAEATLQQWGAEVTLAVNGREAVELVATQPAFDLVLMDLQMPVMSGIEATMRIRRLHGALTLPIIALTADVLVSERDRAMQHGMNDFLAKPIDPQRLVAVLAHWVRRTRSGRG